MLELEFRYERPAGVLPMDDLWNTSLVARPSEPANPSGGPTGDGSARPELTADACEASGGTVVGDIGDGAIHRPDYRCPSGHEPSASIRAPEGGPVAVEGSVCCPK